MLSSPFSQRRRAIRSQLQRRFLPHYALTCLNNGCYLDTWSRFCFFARLCSETSRFLGGHKCLFGCPKRPAGAPGGAIASAPLRRGGSMRPTNSASPNRASSVAARMPYFIAANYRRARHLTPVTKITIGGVRGNAVEPTTCDYCLLKVAPVP